MFRESLISNKEVKGNLLNESDQKFKDILKKWVIKVSWVNLPRKVWRFLDLFFEVILFEEMSKMNSGGFVITQQVVQSMSSPYILKYKSEFLKERYLPGIISGD